MAVRSRDVGKCPAIRVCGCRGRRRGLVVGSSGARGKSRFGGCLFHTVTQHTHMKYKICSKMRFQRLSGRLLMSTTTNPVAGTEPVEPTATSLGPDENVLGAISYLFAPLTGSPRLPPRGRQRVRALPRRPEHRLRSRLDSGLRDAQHRDDGHGDARRRSALLPDRGAIVPVADGTRIRPPARLALPPGHGLSGKADEPSQSSARWPKNTCSEPPLVSRVLEHVCNTGISDTD